LRDDKSTTARAQPAAPVREIVIESEADRWRREGTEFEQRRRIAKAELRCHEQLVEAERARAPDWSAIDARINAALAEQRREFMDLIQGLVDACAETSDTVGKIDNQLAGLQRLLTRLNDGESSMSQRMNMEYSKLRDEFASEREMHARELGLVTKQLAETQRELERRVDLREHAANRMAVAGLSERHHFASALSASPQVRCLTPVSNSRYGGPVSNTGSAHGPDQCRAPAALYRSAEKGGGRTGWR
jgi:hypothetical protein